MSYTDPYADDGPDRWELKPDAIEWLNKSGYTPKIYRGLSTLPVPPEAGERGAPPQLTWHFGLHYLRSPESIDPYEDKTISYNMRGAITDRLSSRNWDNYKDYTVEVPEGVNLQQFIREHEAEVVDPLMYTWVRTVTHKDWDNLEVQEVPLVGTPLRTEHKNPELDQKVIIGDQGLLWWKEETLDAWLQEKGLEPTVRNILQSDPAFEHGIKSVEVDGTRYIRNFVSENEVGSASGGRGIISREVLHDPYYSWARDNTWLYLPHARFPEELVGTVAERYTILPDLKGKEEILEVFMQRPSPGHWRQELYIITKFLPAEDAEE